MLNWLNAIVKWAIAVDYGTGPNTINRENVSRLLVVSANAEGRDLGSVIADIRQRIGQQVHPPAPRKKARRILLQVRSSIIPVRDIKPSC